MTSDPVAVIKYTDWERTESLINASVSFLFALRSLKHLNHLKKKKKKRLLIN